MGQSVGGSVSWWVSQLVDQSVGGSVGCLGLSVNASAKVSFSLHKYKV